MTDTSTIDTLINAANVNKTLRSNAGLVDEEKQARRLVRRAAKIQREQEQQARRASKRVIRSEKLNAKKPAHVMKLDKAALRLPVLDQNLNSTLATLKNSLSMSDIALLNEHLEFAVRSDSTLKAISGNVLKSGDRIEIISGDANHIGKTGIVKNVKRIHAYVDVGGKRDIYIFTSDCKVVLP